jgi:Tol biopolymer transport system component
LRATVAGALTLLVVFAVLTLVACGGLGTTASSSPSASSSQAAASPSVAASPSATPLPAPTVAGTIAFARVDDGYGDIYVVRTDGKGLKEVAAGPDSEEQPDWSPDGGRVAWDSGSGEVGTYSLWTANASGAGKVRLTHGVVFGEYPTWSPDGTRVVFSRYAPADGSYDIALMNADGTGLRKLTSGPEWDRFPAWTPDGKILFVRVDTNDIFSVNADGSGLARRTNLGYVGDFSLSPDGQRLAIHDTLHDRIVLLPATGPEVPQVLVDTVSDYILSTLVASSWSPDGNAIALAASNYYNPPGSALYIVNADGSGLSVVPHTGKVWDPSWRPE